MLRDQITWKQVSTGGYTEISGGEETVESTSGAIRSSSIKSQGTNQHQMAADQCNNIFTMEEYNPVSPPTNYWGHLPSYP
ncbi:hypothetical protein L484_000405 [Morus notabilis]|nr:hypothetical protein L484_000405 [Morus notabilis]